MAAVDLADFGVSDLLLAVHLSKEAPTVIPRSKHMVAGIMEQEISAAS